MPWPTFETEDDVPEAFRDQYHEVDGTWVAKEEEAEPDPAKLGDPGKKALQAEREARTAAEEAQREAETARRKAESDLAELRQKAEAQKAGLNDEQLKKLRADVRADIQKEFAAKPLSELPEDWAARSEAQSALQENRSLKLDSQVKAMAAKHGVRSERLENWWRQFGDRFDLTDDGKPMVKDHPGREVKDFIADDLKKELPDFYTGTQAAGGGKGGIQRDGQLVAGTTADDVIKNPGESLRAAREANEAA